MTQRYEKEIIINPSQMDASGKLAFAAAFDLFVDTATEQADALKIGLSFIGPRGQYWLAAKSKIRFSRRPRMSEKVNLLVWMEQAEGTRCQRGLRLTKDGEILAEGRSQWAVMDMKAGRLIDLDDVYPHEWNGPEPGFRLADFEKLTDFEGEFHADYKVGSNDIDVGHHVNNVAYIRAISSTFTTKEWADLNPVEIEIHYIRSCFEGEILRFTKRTEGKNLYLKGSVGDRTVILTKIESA